MWVAVKYLVTALVVVLVSELAKRSPRLGGLVAAMPIVTLLTLFWLHFENQPQAKLGDYARYTFWYVLPTLPMFLVFPWILPRTGFWGAMFVSVLTTLLCFWLLALGLRRFGVQLL